MEISIIRGIPCLLWIMIPMILSLTGCKGSVKETEEIPAAPTATEGPLEIYLLAACRRGKHINSMNSTTGLNRLLISAKQA